MTRKSKWITKHQFPKITPQTVEFFSDLVKLIVAAAALVIVGPKPSLGIT